MRIDNTYSKLLSCAENLRLLHCIKQRDAKMASRHSGACYIVNFLRHLRSAVVE